MASYDIQQFSKFIRLKYFLKFNEFANQALFMVPWFRIIFSGRCTHFHASMLFIVNVFSKLLKFLLYVSGT